MNGLRTFDWGKCQKTYNPQHFLWFARNHNRTISLAEYVKCMTELKQYSISPLKEKTYSLKNMKRNYKWYQKQFGFFN